LFSQFVIDVVSKGLIFQLVIKSLELNEVTDPVAKYTTNNDVGNRLLLQIITVSWQRWNQLDLWYEAIVKEIKTFQSAMSCSILNGAPGNLNIRHWQEESRRIRWVQSSSLPRLKHAPGPPYPRMYVLH
jgi:hypothetical protein